MIVKVALTPSAKLPTFQAPETLLYVVVPDGIEETKEYPEGNLSVTTTPVASLGPTFVTDILNTAFSPTFGAAFTTVFDTVKSAISLGLLEILLELLAVFESASVLLTSAVFVYTPVANTVAVIFKLVVVPLAKLPIVQTPVPGT